MLILFRLTTGVKHLQNQKGLMSLTILTFKFEEKYTRLVKIHSMNCMILLFKIYHINSQEMVVIPIREKAYTVR